MRREQGVLQRVGGLLAVAERADRDRPQPLLVTGDQTAEGEAVPGRVGGEQRPVVLVGVGTHPVTARSVIPAEKRPSSGARAVSHTSR